MSVKVLSAFLFCCFIRTDSHFEETKVPPLLVVAFDGFRWDYLKKTDTPNFDIFTKKGVHAKHGLKNVFPTMTFPNFYSLSTGLWPESHGVLGNDMYDLKTKHNFSMGRTADQLKSEWFGGEPIWVTNQLQDTDHRSGVYQWPGCTAAVKGNLPSRTVLYDFDSWSGLSNESRVDTVVDWFTSEYPINLGMLYFEEPDVTGHKFGPDSEQVKNMIGGLDKVIGYLIKKLKEKNMWGKINIIILADHGFASQPPDKRIDVTKYVDNTTFRGVEYSPVANILPYEDKLDELYKNLTAASKKEAFKVYKKEELPERFHFKHSDRAMPLILIAEEHYHLSFGGYITKSLGAHGWDNALQDMHPIFLAMGPSFKSGASIDTMNSVDIYPLMCHLLNLKPAPNNGSLQSALPLLAEKTSHHDYTAITLSTYIGILILIASVGGVYMVAACRQHRYLKRRKNQMLPLTNLGSLRYASPPNGAKVPLLSDTEDEELFD